jgi:hypothetical protein
MANVKISELPAASSASGTQEFEVNDSGTSKKVTGDQIKDFFEDGLVSLTGPSGSAEIPSGTLAQRDATPAAGYFRFNLDVGKFEGYNGLSWGSVGGAATGGGEDEIFIQNSQVVTASYTIPANKNAMSTGPITINSGVTVTVSTGARYVVI